MAKTDRTFTERQKRQAERDRALGITRVTVKVHKDDANTIRTMAQKLRLLKQWRDQNRLKGRKMTKPWDFTLFAESVPAEVALRVAGLFAKTAQTDFDHALVKAMLVHLAGLGVDRAEIEEYPELDESLRRYTSGE